MEATPLAATVAIDQTNVLLAKHGRTLVQTPRGGSAGGSNGKPAGNENENTLPRRALACGRNGSEKSENNTSVFFNVGATGSGGNGGRSDSARWTARLTADFVPARIEATSEDSLSWWEKLRALPSQTITSQVAACGLFAQNHAASSSQKGHRAFRRVRRVSSIEEGSSPIRRQMRKKRLQPKIVRSSNQ